MTDGNEQFLSPFDEDNQTSRLERDEVTSLMSILSAVFAISRRFYDAA